MITLAGVVQGVTGAAAFWYAARYISRDVGGRNALRNPWVAGPLLLSAATAIGITVMAWYVYHVRASGLPTGPSLANVFLAGLLLVVIGLAWAGLAAERRRRTIDGLIGAAAIPVDRHQLDDPDEADEARALIRNHAEACTARKELEALRRIVPGTGHAPGHDWLTRHWIEERMARLDSETEASLRNSTLAELAE